MPVCSIYSSVYKPFIKEHNDLTPLFLFSEQTLLSVTTLVCSLKNTQLHCHTSGWKKASLLYPGVFCFHTYTMSSPHTLQTLDGTILKMLSNSPRSTNMTHKWFGWGILFLCEWLKPRTVSSFRWVSLRENNKRTDFIGISKHTAALVEFWGLLIFFSIWPCTTIPSFASPGSNICNVLQILHGKKTTVWLKQCRA